MLERANVSGAATIMEVVIALALLSACNAQLYGNSRLLYSMARGGEAPSYFSQTNASGVPVRAVIVSIIFGFISVAMQWWNPPGLLTFLLNAVGGILIAIWTMVILSYIRLHPQLVASGEITNVRMWGYPWLPWSTFATLGGFILLMLFDAGGRTELISALVVVGTIVVTSLIVHRGKASEPAHMA